MHTNTYIYIIVLISESPKCLANHSEILASHGQFRSSYCETLCVPGLCTQNVTVPITLTSKGTPWIPTMQHSGWHFPLASSRLRQALALHFMFLRLLFRSQTAKKTSLSNSLLFWESRRAAVSSPSVVISKDVWAGILSFWRCDREHPPNLCVFLVPISQPGRWSNEARVVFTLRGDSRGLRS